MSKSLQGIVTHGVLSGSALQVGYPPTPWSCWHLTSLIEAIVCPNFAILIVQSIDGTRGTSSLFCPQRVTETDGLELLVVTNTIPQVSFFSYQVETRREKHKIIATLRRGDLRSVTS